MNANDQHFFVVRAIEDADAPTLRQPANGPPKIIVIEFFSRRLLERGHFAALGIHPRHDVFDAAILPGSIHRLKDEENSPLVLCVQLLLQRAQSIDPLAQSRLRLAGIGIEVAGVVGINGLQAKTGTVIDQIRVDETTDLF